MSQLRREIVKILSRKLTYFGWAGLLVVPVLVSLAVRFSTHRSGPPGMEETGGGFNFDIASASGLYIAIGSIIALSLFGIPVSTTHTITGAIFGVGVIRRLGSVRWSVGKDIVIAWGLTLPASGVMAALIYMLVRRFE